MNMAETLRVTTLAGWLARELTQGGPGNGVAVIHDFGLDLPADDSDLDGTAWWCPGQYATRLNASGIRPGFTTPGEYLLTDLPVELLARRVAVLPLGEVAELNSPARVFAKPADTKMDRFDARIYSSTDDVVVHARDAGCFDNSLLLLSDPVCFVEEHRVFVLDDEPVAASIYVRDGVTWDGMEEADLPASDDATAFATDIISALTGAVLPRGYVLDVGLLTDDRWAVVEANPAWCAGPYWTTSTRQGAEAVVATILASQGFGAGGQLWFPDLALDRFARPLPRRSGA